MGKVTLRGCRPQVSTCLSGQLLLGSLNQAFCPGWNSGLWVASLPQEEGAEHGNTGRLPTAHQSPLCSGTPRGACRLGWERAGDRWVEGALRGPHPPDPDHPAEAAGLRTRRQHLLPTPLAPAAL